MSIWMALLIAVSAFADNEFARFHEIYARADGLARAQTRSEPMSHIREVRTFGELRSALSRSAAKPALEWLAAKARRDLEDNLNGLSGVQIQLRLVVLGLNGNGTSRGYSRISKFLKYDDVGVRLQALVTLKHLMGAESRDFQMAAFFVLLDSEKRLESIEINLDENPEVAQAPVWDEVDLQIEVLEALVGQSSPLPEIIIQYLEHLMDGLREDPLIPEFVLQLLESGVRGPGDTVYQRITSRAFRVESAAQSLSCKVILFPRAASGIN